MKVGLGYDVHKLVENRKLIIGGVEIPHSKGLAGHSDADVLVHAVIDSIVGALGLGDIGRHFPDTSAKYKDIDSLILLEEVYKTMSSRGYIIGNIDCTIAAQQPKLAPFIDQMATKLSGVLKTNKSNINVKATTTENLGFEGRQEGISAQAICLLIKK